MKPPLISLADDPRAGAGIRRAKCWGGLLAFAVTVLGSTMHGADAFSAGLRALGAGIVGYLLVWAVAVSVWRRIVEAEANATVKRVVAQRRAAAVARAKPAEES